MAAHLTEEEQIEAVKRWWKENGKVTVAIILAGIIGWFGWSSWQDRQEQVAQEASAQYAELVAVVGMAQGASLTDDEEATARLIAGEIVASRPDSLYGNFAALWLAKLALDSDDLSEAESQLRNVINRAANPSIAKLANLRLARVLSAQGDQEAALALLTNGDDAYSAAYAEARGDIYVAQNQLELAQTAYEQALASLATQETAGRAGLVQLKLDNTRIAGSESADDDSSVTSGAEGDA